MDSGTLFRTLAGLVIWIGLMIFGGSSGWWNETESILSFGLLVILPIALALVRKAKEGNDHIHQTAVYLQPFAALIAGSSYLIPGGVLAGTLAIAWAPVSVLLAVSGLKTLRKRGTTELEEMSAAFSLVLLPFSAFFLWAERMNIAPFGFSGPASLSLATHLFFAGFAVLLLNGLIGRLVRTKEDQLPLMITFILVVSPVVTAAFLWQPERATSTQAPVFIVQALIYLGIAYLLIKEVFPATDAANPRFFFLFSAVSGAISMGVIIVQALGTLSKFYQLPPGTLSFSHGWIGAVGLIGCGLVGFGFLKKD